MFETEACLYCSVRKVEEIVALLSFFCNPCFLTSLFKGVLEHAAVWILIFLCIVLQESLFCTHTKPQELHKCLVRDFGGLKSIVGVQLCVHSCFLFELPPDHTRRITYNSWGEMEEVFIIGCRFISTLAGCFTVEIPGIRKQINEYLRRCGLWNAFWFSLKTNVFNHHPGDWWWKQS